MLIYKYLFPFSSPTPIFYYSADKFEFSLCDVALKLHEIGAAVCDYQHTILKEFRGKRANDIYVAMFKYNDEHKKNWFKVLDHAAYLGK